MSTFQHWGAGFGDRELVGVGIGPGDPGLITLRAAEIIRQAELVIAPAASRGDASLAAAIIAAAGLKPRALLELEFPMVREEARLAQAWQEAALPILSAMDAGKTVAFITLGDLSLYSTWTYCKRAVLNARPNTRIGSVAGVMAANAAAAALGLSLAEKDERMAIVPLPDPTDRLDALLGLIDRIVVYKIGSRLGELAAWAESHKLEASVACAVGQSGRERLGSLHALAALGVEGYLSLAIIEAGSYMGARA
jgi:precorrin-2/cobalt-factor-2 C20-methyltransferase